MTTMLSSFGQAPATEAERTVSEDIHSMLMQRFMLA